MQVAEVRKRVNHFVRNRGKNILRNHPGFEFSGYGQRKRVGIFARKHFDFFIRRTNKRAFCPRYLFAGNRKQIVGFRPRKHKARTARRGIFIANFGNFFLYHLQLQIFALRNRGKFFNEFLQFFQFLFQLEYFQLGKAREAQIQNRLRLNFGKFETLHQFRARVRGAFRRLDNGNHFVDVAHGDNQPFQHVATAFRFVQIELGTAQNHLPLVRHVMADDFHQPQLLRLAVRYHHHIDAEGYFKVGIFIQYL